MLVETWIPITIAAAFFQNLRSALQKHLKGRLSNTGAAYVRFLYALPLALAYLLALHRLGGLALPRPNETFYLYCVVGGVCQIMFTVFLMWMFSFRSFVVGTTFSKLEIVMVAGLGVVLLGESLSPLAVTAIFISAVGLVALSLGQAQITLSTLIAGIGQQSTLIGILCAAWLGGSVVFFRGAALSLEHHNFIMAASFTLAVSLVIQTSLMGGWLLVKEAGELTRVLKAWRWAGLVGITGFLASVGWFTAFTIHNAAYVRALGQVELIFTFVATTLVFREKVTAAEVVGTLLVSAAILMILFAA